MTICTAASADEAFAIQQREHINVLAENGRNLQVVPREARLLLSPVEETDGRPWSYYSSLRPHGSQAALEARRRRAVTLLDQGHRVTHVARRIGCSHRSVVRWRDVVAEQGAAGLNAKPIPGCPAKLTERQRERIPTLVVRGALAWGFRTDLWTTPRIAEVIRRTFGVRYHPTPIGRLLIELGWSGQQPERRALERDEPAIADWTGPTWRAIKKKPAD